MPPIKSSLVRHYFSFHRATGKSRCTVEGCQAELKVGLAALDLLLMGLLPDVQ